MNEEFNINNYDSLDNSADNIRNTINLVKTDIEDSNTTIQNILNDSSFQGPIADHCANAWQEISNKTMNNLNNFNSNANALNEINNNYKNTDSNVSNSIGGI